MTGPDPSLAARARNLHPITGKNLLNNSTRTFGMYGFTRTRSVTTNGLRQPDGRAG